VVIFSAEAGLWFTLAIINNPIFPYKFALRQMCGADYRRQESTAYKAAYFDGRDGVPLRLMYTSPNPRLDIRERNLSNIQMLGPTCFLIFYNNYYVHLFYLKSDFFKTRRLRKTIFDDNWNN